jgi:hypothetical protein
MERNAAPLTEAQAKSRATWQGLRCRTHVGLFYDR